MDWFVLLAIFVAIISFLVVGASSFDEDEFEEESKDLEEIKAELQHALRKPPTR